MTHTMTEEEYAQYLKDKKEIDNYKAWEKGTLQRIQDYFHSVKVDIEIFGNKNFSVFTECRIEKGYCDLCPVVGLGIKCPIAREKHGYRFSK